MKFNEATFGLHGVGLQINEVCLKHFLKVFEETTAKLANNEVSYIVSFARLKCGFLQVQLFLFKTPKSLG